VSAGITLRHAELREALKATLVTYFKYKVISGQWAEPLFKYVAYAVTLVLLPQAEPGILQHEPELEVAGLSVLNLVYGYHGLLLYLVL